MSMFRSRLTVTFPSSNSNTPGTAFEGMPIRRHASAAARTTEPGAVGIAMTASSTPCTLTASLRLLGSPRTGMP